MNNWPDDSDPEIIVNQDGPLGILILNRPQALHALTLEMVRIISGTLTRWNDDESVAAVFIYASGERAFCAGGDIKAAYRTGMQYRRGNAAENTLTLFFEEEYEFNSLLFHYEKPLVAFMDGITMGGGYGLAGPCSHRIVTDKTVFAMPETGIGFFPDVGSMYFLNRCPRNSGCYLAVTGATIGPADTLYTGLADYYMPEQTAAKIQDALITGLAKSPDRDNYDVVSEVLETLSSDIDEEPELKENADLIDVAFGKETIDYVFEALDADGSEFAERVKRIILLMRSPTSVKVALQYYKWADARPFNEILEQDLRLAAEFLKQHDFYEGVRAMVIDKDREPRWDPEMLEDVTSPMVERYFAVA